jgi:hypothetical protein
MGQGAASKAEVEGRLHRPCQPVRGGFLASVNNINSIGLRPPKRGGTVSLPNRKRRSGLLQPKIASAFEAPVGFAPARAPFGEPATPHRRAADPQRGESLLRLSPLFACSVPL